MRPAKSSFYFVMTPLVFRTANIFFLGEAFGAQAVRLEILCQRVLPLDQCYHGCLKNLKMLEDG